MTDRTRFRCRNCGEWHRLTPAMLAGRSVNHICSKCGEWSVIHNQIAYRIEQGRR